MLEFMQQIKEILLDLNDDGFDIITDSELISGRNARNDFTNISRITVEVNYGERIPDLSLYFGKKDCVFNYSEVENPIGHLVLFMKDSGYVLTRISLSSKMFVAPDTSKGVSLSVLNNLEISGYIKFYFRIKDDPSSKNSGVW